MESVTLAPALVRAVDEHMRLARDRDGVRGIAYGVVAAGVLVHAGGIGELAENGGTPDEHSLFRMASLTKSFTASAVMHLRDAGRLRLDDPVAAHVPEAAALRGPTADSPAITLRHLLTMASGLAGDNPWADRHVDVGRATMNAWLRGGATFAHAPGTAYEYSNLGYGILGRVVENVSGRTLQSYVTNHLLIPLGMASTVWTLDAAPDGVCVAEGYQRIDGAWTPVGAPLGDGDLAALGGLWSTVSDLARWVTFFTDAFPARDDPDTMPLARASRREMQEVATSWPLSMASRHELTPPRAGPAGYGMGLCIRDDLVLGRLVEHAGGFPGFGSHMLWLPGRDAGVILLANETYAPMGVVAADLVETLGEHHGLPRAHVPHAPVLERAAARLGGLVAAWDTEVAGELFSDNVFLDRPEAKRIDEAAQLRHRHGRLGDATFDARTLTAGTMRWQTECGELRATLTLSPRVPPRVQWYEFTSVLPLGPAHAAAFTALLDGVRDPGTIRVGALFTEEAQVTRLRERLRAVQFMFGACAQAETVACDGGSTATVHWCGERADLDVAVTCVGDRIAQVAFHARPIGPAAE